MIYQESFNVSQQHSNNRFYYQAYTRQELFSDEKQSLMSDEPLLRTKQKVLIGLFSFLLLLTNLGVIFYDELHGNLCIYILFTITCSVIGLVVVSVLFDLISTKNTYSTVNSVPLVPYLPVISIIINVHLMTQLSWSTWLRFAIWYCIGLPIYFLYGIKNSKCCEDQSEASLKTYKTMQDEQK